MRLALTKMQEDLEMEPEPELVLVLVLELQREIWLRELRA